MDHRLGINLWFGQMEHLISTVALIIVRDVSREDTLWMHISPCMYLGSTYFGGVR